MASSQLEQPPQRGVSLIFRPSGGHPAIETAAPQALDDAAFVAAVVGVDHVDVDPGELVPPGVYRFGDDTPREQ